MVDEKLKLLPVKYNGQASASGYRWVHLIAPIKCLEFAAGLDGNGIDLRKFVKIPLAASQSGRNRRASMDQSVLLFLAVGIRFGLGLWSRIGLGRCAFAGRFGFDIRRRGVF